MPQREQIGFDLNMICKYTHQSSHRQPVPGFETYRCYRSPNLIGFVFFTVKNLPQNTKRQGGWKFHLSIHREDVVRAWPYIATVLLDPKRGVAAFKVIDTVLYEEIDRDVKQVVIYTFKDAEDQLLQAPDEMFATLIELEKGLRMAYVRPGAMMEEDLKIPGSRYISMRYDLVPGSTDKYISAAQALELNPACPYNPFNQPNPYHGFSMSRYGRRFFSTPGFGFYREVKAKLIDNMALLREDNSEKVNYDHEARYAESGSRCMPFG